MARSFTRRSLLGGAASILGATAARAEALERLAGASPDAGYDVIVVGAGSAGLSAALGAHRAEPGASIVVLEAKPNHGGTSARSGGRMWIPNNSDMLAAGINDPRDMALRYMARLSYPDDYDPAEPELGLSPRHFAQLATYYDEGAEIFEHYRNEGILDWEAERWLPFPWNADPLELRGQYSPDYHPELPENVPGRGRGIITKHFEPTGATEDAQAPLPNYGASLAGSDLAQWLYAACVRRGIQFLPASRVTGLLTRRSGDRLVVEGVRAGIALDDVTVATNRPLRATRGVVFTSGGFSKDRARLDRHFTGLRSFNGGGCAVTSARGDLVALAEHHGFHLEHMDKAWFIQNIYEQYVRDPDSRTQANYLLFQAYWLNGDSMFVVNRRGRRVVNEKVDYDTRTRAHFHPDNRYLLCVVDQSTLDRYLVSLGGQVTPMVQTLIGPAANGEELRSAVLERFSRYPDLAAFGLAEDFSTEFGRTVRRFNAFARAGLDEDFGRGETAVEIWWHCLSLYFQNLQAGGATIVTDPVSGNVDEHGHPYPNPTMRPLTPPYYAVILSQGLQDTKGGPAIDEGGRVIARDGRPVEGLYGAGNAVASPAADGYWGPGGTLGPAMVFGHIAGRNAARRA